MFYLKICLLIVKALARTLLIRIIAQRLFLCFIMTQIQLKSFGRHHFSHHVIIFATRMCLSVNCLISIGMEVYKPKWPLNCGLNTTITIQFKLYILLLIDIST